MSIVTFHNDPELKDNVGVSLDGLADRLAVRAETVAAIELCIAALEGKDVKWSAARSAAWKHEADRIVEELKTLA